MSTAPGQTDVTALLDRGDSFARDGDARAAMSFYQTALQTARTSPYADANTLNRLRAGCACRRARTTLDAAALSRRRLAVRRRVQRDRAVVECARPADDVGLNRPAGRARAARVRVGARRSAVNFRLHGLGGRARRGLNGRGVRRLRRCRARRRGGGTRLPRALPRLKAFAARVLFDRSVLARSLRRSVHHPFLPAQKS